VLKKERSGMAGRIQGITVEIGGDTTKLQTALKGVNTEIRNTQSQLRDVDRLLKLDPGNTELLAQKHRLLGDAVKETKEKLEKMAKKQAEAEREIRQMDMTEDDGVVIRMA
jgi:phage-related minor tail protein